MKIESIQVGLPKEMSFNGKTFLTGIIKNPVDGPVLLEKLNLVGDRQAELSVHGGVDKALYAYPLDAYQEWERVRPAFRVYGGAMGENLTITTLDEKNMFIGDVYQLGKAVVQVSEPRLPCFKLAAMYQDMKIIKQFMQVKRPGVYFRVLEEGPIDRGDELKLLKKEEIRLSIMELYDLERAGAADIPRIKELMTMPTLARDWRDHFEELLKKL